MIKFCKYIFLTYNDFPYRTSLFQPFLIDSKFLNSFNFSKDVYLNTHIYETGLIVKSQNLDSYNFRNESFSQWENTTDK